MHHDKSKIPLDSTMIDVQYCASLMEPADQGSQPTNKSGVTSKFNVWAKTVQIIIMIRVIIIIITKNIDNNNNNNCIAEPSHWDSDMICFQDSGLNIHY